MTGWSIADSSWFTQDANSDTPTGATWSEDTTFGVMRIRVKGAAATPAITPTISLSPVQNPVTEGSNAEIRIMLSSALATDIAVSMTATAVTAESGDLAGGTFAITIPAGLTVVTLPVTTNQDYDGDDETFTVTLGSLPSSVTAGTPTSLTITITDDDEFLVSNLGQLTAGALTTATRVQAQGFTTGSASGGYTLSSIEAVLKTTVSAANRATIRAELWSAATGGGPDSKLASLTVPSSISTTATTNTVAFAAPSNTTLAASTTYYLVIYTVGTFNASVGGATSNNEDSGGAAGWSVADVGHFLTTDVPGASNSWTDDPSKVGIRVNGPAASTTLSNNANLTGLTAKTATSATGTYTPLNFGTFNAQAVTARIRPKSVAGRHHPPETDGDGESLLRHHQGRQGLQPDGGGQRRGERRHPALDGRQRHQRRGHRPGRHDEADLHPHGDEVLHHRLRDPERGQHDRLRGRAGSQQRGGPGHRDRHAGRRVRDGSHLRRDARQRLHGEGPP